jgi:hypothetical protein
MPLAVGNEWIGQVTNYNDQGAIDSVWNDTLKISQSQIVRGETWYYMNIFWLTNDTGHAWFTDRPDGIYSCDSGQFDHAWRFA